MGSSVGSGLEARAKTAREALDAWVREVVAWHFDPATGTPFWLALVLGNMVAFNLCWDLGMLAFYFVETQAVFIAQYILMAVFSGQIAPYSLLPGVLKSLATFTPFRYTLSFPLEIPNGRISGERMWQGMAMQVAWLLGLYLIGKIAWRYGSRKYTGVGL